MFNVATGCLILLLGVGCCYWVLDVCVKTDPSSLIRDVVFDHLLGSESYDSLSG